MSVDPNISAYFRQLQAMRRNPYKGFKDNPELASEAGKRGGYNRWHGTKKKQTPDEEDTPQKGHDQGDDNPIPQVPQWQ